MILKLPMQVQRLLQGLEARVPFLHGCSFVLLSFFGWEGGRVGDGWLAESSM